MQIIKDRKIIEDNWTHIADDDEISEGNIRYLYLDGKKKKQSYLPARRMLVLDFLHQITLRILPMI